MADSFSGGGSRSTRREPATLDKQLVNFITCGCESGAPFFCNLQSWARTHAVLVIGLYELLDPTSNILNLSVLDEGYIGKTSCSLDYVSIFFINYMLRTTRNRILQIYIKQLSLRKYR